MIKKVVAAIALLLSCSSVMSATHCKLGEAVYFSCKIKKSARTVSLCGSPANISDAKSVWLQYRFGELNSKSIFTYPADKKGSIEHFEGETHAFQSENGIGRSYNNRVWFNNGNASYGVVVDEGDNYFYGVWVDIGKKHVSLPCDGTKEIDFGDDTDFGQSFLGLVRDLKQVDE